MTETKEPNTLIRLDETDSTNTWAKAHLDRFGPVGAVYTTSQTAGRGRLGRQWVNANGQALYYTAVLQIPLADTAALSLYSSLAAARALRRRYGVDCRIKWPNDLLLHGKKIVGILCETVVQGHQVTALSGIGFNLAQPQHYFDAAGLPHGTSLALEGAQVHLPEDADALARDLTAFGFDRELYPFEREGFAACREEYKALCVNLGRHVTFEGGSGTAVDIDEQGRLVVEDDAGGDVHVFTGEVSVQGIYGAV